VDDGDVKLKDDKGCAGGEWCHVDEAISWKSPEDGS
jgi:hypothetical protein